MRVPSPLSLPRRSGMSLLPDAFAGGDSQGVFCCRGGDYQVFLYFDGADLSRLGGCGR